MQKINSDATNVPFVAMGLFGFVVTFGLFMYELRGIQDCQLLRKRAEELERRMNVPEAESQFHRDPAKFGGLANENGTVWIVYPAVLLSWVYVAGTRPSTTLIP